MNTDTFVSKCIKYGYASTKDKNRIINWCKENYKEEYNEDDFINVYRYLENIQYCSRNPNSKWRLMSNGARTTKHYANNSGD